MGGGEVEWWEKEGWERFKDGEILDEASLQLLDRLSKVDDTDMGNVLIEQKKLISKLILKLVDQHNAILDTNKEEGLLKTSDEEEVSKKEKKIDEDKQNLQNLIHRLRREEKDLKLTQEERAEHMRLQSEYKQQIEKCHHQQELLLKERQDLKQDKENFEKQWELLDERRVEISQDLKLVAAEKDSFEKIKRLDEDALRNKKLDLLKALEEFRLQKESFEAMKNERSLAFEEARREHEDMLCKLRLRKWELEADMHMKREETERHLSERERTMEAHLWERERAFEEQRDSTLNNMWNEREELERRMREREWAFEEQMDNKLTNMNYLQEDAARKLEDLKLERLKIDVEKQNFVADKQHLERQQLDMKKDIEKLDNLVKNMRHQRAQLKRLVNKYKSCKNCGEMIDEFILSDLGSWEEMDDFETVYSPSWEGAGATDTSPLGTGSENATSGKRMVWLCEYASRMIN